MRPHALLLALALTPPTVAPAAQNPSNNLDPEAIARRADRSLAELRSLEAGFVQRAANPILEKTEIGHGTLYYRAPGEYRIEYRYPPGDVVVDDGVWVWIYLPSSQPEQVIRQPAEGVGGGNPLAYLRDLRSFYSLRLEGREPVSDELCDHLAMDPISDDAPFTRVDVWVGVDSGLVRQVATRAEDGVEKSYTFTTLRRGISIPDSRFRFSPPPGVEVYEP